MTLSKKKTVSQLKKKVDKVFSLWIRKRDKRCFTCGRPASQAGHFQSRRFSATRYDEINVQSQCIKCNIFCYGEQYIFGEKLNLVYGEGTAEKLRKKAQKLHQFTVKELDGIIEKYEKV